MKVRAASLVLVFGLVSGSVYAAGGAPPPPGPPPDPKQLAAQLAALTARVSKLEGNITAADLAGTYSVFVFENHLASPAHSSGGVRFQEFTGTVTVDANGNGSYNISGFAGANLTLAGVLDPSPNGGPITGNFTASYANGVVTVVNFAGGTFSLNVAVGGRVFIGIVPTLDAVNERFTDSLVIMTRLQ